MLSADQLSRLSYLLNDEWVTDDESTNIDRFLAALTPLGPIELHQFAANFNCDCGCEELVHVISHPQCDRGTALMLYWTSGPGWFLQYASRDSVPDHELESYDFIQLVESRYLADEFDSKVIRIDPRNIEGIDYTAKYKAQGGVARVPEAMIAPSDGAPVEILGGW